MEWVATWIIEIGDNKTKQEVRNRIWEVGLIHFGRLGAMCYVRDKSYNYSDGRLQWPGQWHYYFPIQSHLRSLLDRMIENKCHTRWTLILYNTTRVWNSILAQPTCATYLWLLRVSLFVSQHPRSLNRKSRSNISISSQASYLIWVSISVLTSISSPISFHETLAKRIVQYTSSLYCT